jgi:glutaminase
MRTKNATLEDRIEQAVSESHVATLNYIEALEAHNRALTAIAVFAIDRGIMDVGDAEVAHKTVSLLSDAAIAALVVISSHEKLDDLAQGLGILLSSNGTIN